MCLNAVFDFSFHFVIGLLVVQKDVITARVQRPGHFCLIWDYSDGPYKLQNYLWVV